MALIGPHRWKFLPCYELHLEGIIDAAYYGAFNRKSAEEANQLIEDLAKSNYRASSETSGSSRKLRGGGVIELNRMIG